MLIRITEEAFADLPNGIKVNGRALAKCAPAFRGEEPPDEVVTLFENDTLDRVRERIEAARGGGKQIDIIEITDFRMPK